MATGGIPIDTQTDSTDTRSCRLSSAGRSDNSRSDDCCCRISVASYLVGRRAGGFANRLHLRFDFGWCDCWSFRIGTGQSDPPSRKCAGRPDFPLRNLSFGFLGRVWRHLGLGSAAFALAIGPNFESANHLFCHRLSCFPAIRRRQKRITRAPQGPRSSLIVKFSW